MNLASDRRWQRLNQRQYRCPCCGLSFNGLFDIAYDHPDPWPHGNREKAGADAMEVGGDLLSSDLCTFGEHRFIRCRLPIPILGSDQHFGFGAWSSLSARNFVRYVGAWRDEDYSDLEDLFGWLSNTLPGVGMSGDPLPCTVTGFAVGRRPELWVHSGEHALADMQEQGITFDQLLDIYAASGTDIRPHLGDA